VTTGRQDPGGGQLRAGHADRERVIETLKDAFAHGRLSKDEFDERAGRALVARTGAGLAALTADLPPGPPAQSAPGPAAPPAPARAGRPLARAAAASAGCLVVMTAAGWAARLADPGPAPSPYQPFAFPLVLIAFLALIAALGTLAFGLAAALERRRARRAPRQVTTT